jgi:hypothetical protein
MILSYNKKALSIMTAFLVILSSLSVVANSIQFARAQQPLLAPGGTANVTGSSEASAPLQPSGNGTVSPSAPARVAESTGVIVTPEEQKKIEASLNETLEYPQSLARAAVPASQQKPPEPDSATFPGTEAPSLDINASNLEKIVSNLNSTKNMNTTGGMNNTVSSGTNTTSLAALQQVVPITVYKKSPVGPGLVPFTHVITEPSVANKGPIVFYTGNIFAARSVDFGTSWKAIDPRTGMPSFCCDQDVMFDKTTQTFIWYRQGRADASGQNVNLLGLSKDASSWWFYALRPTGISSAWTHQWFDYPHLALSNKWLYLSTNVFDSGGSFVRTLMVRYDLRDLSSAMPVHFQYFWESTQFNYTPVQGAKDTMYWATHNAAALGLQEKIYKWPDLGPITTYITSVPGWSFGARNMHCAAPNGVNWCERSDSRIIGGWISRDLFTGREVVGFTWNAREGGPFRYPYINVVTFNVDPTSVVLKSNPKIWHPNLAWMYGYVSPAANGNLGLVAYYGGGAFYTNIAAGVVDSSSGPPPPWKLATIKAGNSAASLWGDYLRDRPYNGVGNLWIAAAATLQGCNTNACVEPLFFAFW